VRNLVTAHYGGPADKLRWYDYNMTTFKFKLFIIILTREPPRRLSTPHSTQHLLLLLLLLLLFLVFESVTNGSCLCEFASNSTYVYKYHLKFVVLLFIL